MIVADLSWRDSPRLSAAARHLCGDPVSPDVSPLINPRKLAVHVAHYTVYMYRWLETYLKYFICRGHEREPCVERFRRAFRHDTHGAPVPTCPVAVASTAVWPGCENALLQPRNIPFNGSNCALSTCDGQSASII